jgi:hypothetical protein
MTGKNTRDVDGIRHHKAGSVDQQSEDSFPASDAPGFSPGTIGAPAHPELPHTRSRGKASSARHKNGKQKSEK